MYILTIELFTGVLFYAPKRSEPQKAKISTPCLTGSARSATVTFSGEKFLFQFKTQVKSQATWLMKIIRLNSGKKKKYLVAPYAFLILFLIVSQLKNELKFIFQPIPRKTPVTNFLSISPWQKIIAPPTSVEKHLLSRAVRQGV